MRNWPGFVSATAATFATARMRLPTLTGARKRVLSFVSYQTFFLVIAATAVLGFVTLLFMEEPNGQIAEVNDDGSVTLINVALT